MGDKLTEINLTEINFIRLFLNRFNLLHAKLQIKSKFYSPQF